MLIKASGFYRGNFILNDVGDTYLDLKDYKNGFVVINGHNLGRFWDKGPQHRLYCPAPWLKKGVNEVIVFDMEEIHAQSITAYKSAN